MDRWRGRVALVTGASAGIGAGIATELARQGMKVAVCARRLNKLEDLRNDARKSNFPGEIFPIQCDLRKEEDILKMFQFIRKELGGADICINNAGVGFSDCSLLGGTTEQWREILDVNVLALSICTREAVKCMRERGVDDGQIIHISSMSGHRLTIKEEHFYAISKQSVRAHTEALRSELRELGSHIRIASISPANVRTELMAQTQGSASNPAPALDVSDIVDSVIFVLSAKPHSQVHDILIRCVEQAS